MSLAGQTVLGLDILQLLGKLLQAKTTNDEDGNNDDLLNDSHAQEDGDVSDQLAELETEVTASGKVTDHAVGETGNHEGRSQGKEHHGLALALGELALLGDEDG